MKNSNVLLALQLTLIIAFVGADDPPPCEKLSCAENCPYGFAINISGCSTCECKEEVCQAVICSVGKICKKFHLTATNTEIARCVDPSLPEKCQQPMDAGLCKASQVKWFFDADTEQCLQFNYGGCPGNDNRFDTQSECDSTCPTKCGDVMCTMYCEKGFKKDHRGCEVCICEDDDPAALPLVPQNKDFAVGLGCDAMACDLHCPFDYQKDEYGCEICKCNFPPSCDEALCQMECSYGFRTDSDGCPKCECREKGECNEFQCLMYCEFGFKKDNSECNLCECNPHPCATFECPDGTNCLLSNYTADTTPTCLMHESWSINCPSVTCMLHCEHGYKSDMRGCGICECLDKEKGSCPDAMCRRVCEFGFQKNEYGCDVCKCLPNPCEEKVCENNQVCEIVNDCIGKVCNYKAKCSERNAIKRVQISISFSHEKPLDAEHMDDFLKNVKESLAKILNIDGDEITNIKAKQDNNTVYVTFHLIRDGKEDLVEAWQMAETHIKTKARESAITYNGQEFVPEHDSLVSLYSSNAAIEQEDGDEGGSATVTIVIACVVVGAGLLVVAVIVFVFVKKSKTTEKKRKNVIYKKAPEDRDSLA